MAKRQQAPDYRQVAASLREMRAAAGLTQRDLAERLGRSQPWVHKSEIGERRVDIGEWVAWCDGCDVGPTEALIELMGDLPRAARRTRRKAAQR